MSRRRTAFHAILALGYLALCSLAAGLTPGAVFAQGDGRPEPGSPIPPFTLPDVQGKDIAMPRFTGGKPALLTFWSTW
ncbi:MAG TPA: hypothetical protein GX507_01860 [Clostridia bacterium]|nr:hypothetical protein [Clostridia bacterium]